MPEPRCHCNCHDPAWRKEARKHEHRTHLYCQKYLLKEADAIERIADRQIAEVRERVALLESLLREILSRRVLAPAEQERAERILSGAA